MAKFILLLTGEGDYSTLSPAEMEATYKSYGDWVRKLRAEDRLLDAEELSTEGKTLHPGLDPAVTDGPFAESKEAIGGYFIITAADLDEAATVAKGCPNLQHGGTVHLCSIQDHMTQPGEAR